MRGGDTTPDARRAQQALIQRLSGPERVRMAIQMSEDAREICLAGIRSRNPSWSEERARRELLERIYGVDLVTRAWGPADNS